MKRYFLYLAAVVLLLPLFSAFALTPCEHYPGQVADNELEEVNRIPPQEGIDGSVDLCCPICHQVVDSTVLPALPVSAEHPASSDEENPPSAPESAVQQEQELTSQPEPAVQQEQELPSQPGSVSVTEPESPVQPVQPEAPVSAEGNTEAIAPAESGTTSQVSVAAPPEANDVTGNVPQQTSGSTGGSGSAGRSGRTNSGGNSGNGTTDENNRPQTFPFRRIRMKPKPGIRAEAAGELLWPVYGTPFQNLYSD